METTERRWPRRAAIGVAVLALAAFGHLCAVKGGDFKAFYDVGEATLRHGDVYAAGPRMRMNVFYAPNFSLLLAPFALLPPYLAAWVWYLLKLGMMVGLVRWIDRAVRREAPGLGPRARVALVALPFVAAFNPFQSEFRLGQANLLVLFFSVLTVQALERGRPLRGALWFSIAAVKITPLALLPWLAFRRQWRFFLALLAVGGAWLAALAAWWGPAAVLPLFRRWVEVTATKKAIPAIIAFHENQSLQGAAARLAGVLGALERPAAGVAAWQWLWILPSLAVVVLLALLAARDGFRARLLPEEFAISSLLMLLASSDSRYAHHVQLLVPLAVLTALAARVGLVQALPRVGPWLAPGEPPAAAGDAPARKLRGQLSWLLGASLTFYVLLGRDTVGPAANHALRALSLGTALDVALLAFLAARLLRRADAPLDVPARSLSALP